ncbi:MAG TPA: MazG family protein [Candidatus Limnocylindria bacterium]|nr:MazG family protein [Candidatus Limnocylindria bacterium]
MIPASALDRHSFSTLRPVVLVLDAEPDMAVLRKHYGDDVRPEPLGPRFALLPPREPYVDLASVAAVTRIAERLRAEGGCPWDREQTHESLRPHLLEEAYEALEALDSGDLDRLRDELGDLLFQIAIHAQLAHEEGAFDISDVARRLGEKLVRRHPHVFAATEISGDLLAQWERIKREEREAGGNADESILSGVPKDLPALFAAERLQERSARVGVVHEPIDFPLDIDDPAFLGDLLFDLVAAARTKGFDAETALREANERFAAHVARIEERARGEGRALESYAPEEMRRMWEESLA